MRRVFARVYGFGTRTGNWTFPVNCIAAQLRIRSHNAAASIDGMNITQTFGWDTTKGGPVQDDFPVIYDQQRRPIRYDQVFGFQAAGTAFLGSFTLLHMDGDLSPDLRINVRVIPLWAQGSGPFHVDLDCVAVLWRIGNYDQTAATVEGQLLSSTWASQPPGPGIMLDWPPVYDQDFRLIPYRQRINFNGAGTVISGSAIVFELAKRS